MDYSKLSDFEINSAVHNAGLNEPYSLVFMGDDRIAWTKENGEQVITDKVPYTKNGVHDYCSDATAALPIIMANRIALYPATVGEQWAAHYADWDIAHADKNALRAAMIVYLQMQESANVQDNPA